MLDHIPSILNHGLKDVPVKLPYLHWEHYAVQKRIQHEIDDANDEIKVQRQEGPEEKKRRMERRKTRPFSFDEIRESGAASGTDTPGHNSKGNKGKKLVEVAVDHLREWMAPGASDESDASSDTMEKSKQEKKPRWVPPTFTRPGLST